MIRRYELSDLEWEMLVPYLPSVVTGGRPRGDDRRVLNGIVWKIRAGAAWRDLPARYGSWQSVYAGMKYPERTPMIESLPGRFSSMEAAASVYRPHRRATALGRAGYARFLLNLTSAPQ